MKFRPLVQARWASSGWQQWSSFDRCGTGEAAAESDHMQLVHQCMGEGAAAVGTIRRTIFMQGLGPPPSVAFTVPLAMPQLFFKARLWPPLSASQVKPINALRADAYRVATRSQRHGECRRLPVN